MTAALTFAALGAGLLGIVVFVALYSIRAPWWRSSTGWALVVFATAGGLLMANGLVVRLAGNYPGRAQVSLGLFVAIAAAAWWFVVLMLRATRKQKGPS